MRRSTIGAGAFDGRVRDGIGYCRFARAARPAKGGSGEDDSFLPSVFCLLSSVKQWFLGLDGGRRTEDGRFYLPSSVLRPLSGTSIEDESDQAGRAISTGQLSASPRVHIRPIDVVVFHGSSGRNRLEAGFPLRCLQRLSFPHIATLHCGWRHNRSTRGAFVPVLSY